VTTLRVIVDDRDGPALAGKRITQTVPGTALIVGLPAGTSEGKPAVLITAELPDGSYVYIETTLALFQTANGALRGRYGDVS